MDKRILVTYASKAGSTAEIAERIGQAFIERNYAVDILPISRINDLNSYRAVILGSAIRVRNILPEAMSFIQKHQETLHIIPFSIFIVCLSMKDDDACTRKNVREYLDPVYKFVEPASVGLFAGVLNPKRLGLMERMLVKAINASEGDFRRWDQIETWAQNIPTL